MQRIHFIGIGGVGMSGVAEVLHNLGYTVSGSDIATNYNTERLAGMGVSIHIGHAGSNVGSAEVVVTSTAVHDNNPEVIYAIDHGITIVPRAMMLAELMRFKSGIAIAGTHGKTTTTSLCAEVLSSCGLDPTFIIGGKLAVTGSNAKLGSGEYLIAEADESDASFLYLHPLIAVVTNIDLDHMETYAHDENKLKDTFVQFLHQLPFYGRAILCANDARVRSIIPQIKRPILTYGLDSSCDLYAKDIKNNNGRMEFLVCSAKLQLREYPVSLNLYGIHNVLNALAVIAVGLECNVSLEQMAPAFAKFHGVGRRCQHYPDITWNSGKSAKLIDDYGHHPVELKATISALKDAYPQKRMVLLFQPHRYTRTRDLFADFVSVLKTVDKLILLDVYPAGEEPIACADSQALVTAINDHGVANAELASDLPAAKSLLSNILQNGDLVVTMGAGSIGKLPQLLLEHA